MKFYHVLISHEKEPDGLRQIFEDLDKNELEQKFLRPYRKGKGLIFGGDVFSVKQIKRFILFVQINAMKLNEISC